MPEYTYGGGGDEGAAETKKLVDLKKYASKPDANIREIFWVIMAAYAMKKDMKNDIPLFKNSRTALMRIALSIFENPESAYYGLSLNFTALYTLMMILDGGWEDTFTEFIVKGYEEKKAPITQVKVALKKLLANKNYRETLIGYMKNAAISPNNMDAALAYASEMEDGELVESMKKQLMIIARSHVEETQRDAMRCLSLLREQEDVKMLLITLLSHWDAETRKAAAGILKDFSDEQAVAAAKKRLAEETDPYVKKLLTRIIGKNAKKVE